MNNASYISNIIVIHCIDGISQTSLAHGAYLLLEKGLTYKEAVLELRKIGIKENTAIALKSLCYYI